MLNILSKEQAFQLMERNYEALRPHQIIDLMHEGRRCPAYVRGVYRGSRSFLAVLLDRQAVREVDAFALGGDQPPRMRTVEVALPDAPCDSHPMWNTLQDSQETAHA